VNAAVKGWVNWWVLGTSAELVDFPPDVVLWLWEFREAAQFLQVVGGYRKQEKN
jgi:hypothetical protein